MSKTLLTGRFVSSATCPADKKRICYSDQKVAGLILEVRQSGGKSFYVRYRDPYGSQRNYRISDASSITLAAARDITVGIMSKVAAGVDPFAEKEERRAVPTVKGFFDEWYLPHAQSDKRSWKSDVCYFKHHIDPYIGSKRVDAVTTADILNIKKTTKGRGYAEGSCDRVLILVRYMFNLMIHWKIGNLETNPSEGVKLFHPKNARERFLTKDEIMRLLEALDQSVNASLRDIVMFLLLTGARKQEALRAAWEDFDIQRGFWLIPETKSGRPRAVPLSDRLLQLLTMLPSQGSSPWLFPNPKTGKPFVAVFHSWNTARKQADLADVRMHDLRHSFASFLVNSGRSIYEVKELLGHAHVKTTERYAHLDNKTLTSAVNTAGNFVDINRPLRTINTAPAALAPPEASVPRQRVRPQHQGTGKAQS